MSPKPQKIRLIFYVVLVIIPILFIAAIEGGLRLVNYGQTIPLFVPFNNASSGTDTTPFLMPNPNIVERYFHRPELAPNVAPDTFLFTREKSSDTLRIVVMGGSSAAGFPFGRFGSPTGMLKQQLKYIYPNKNIELISVAMASINSYALRDFMAEVANIEPDAVLIYAGHNEFLGIMGVGSNFASYGGHWANLSFNFLRDFRLFQLFQSLLTSAPPKSISGAQVSHSGNSGRTVMATVAREKNIPLNSPLYQLGVQQFNSNIGAVLGFFKQQNIPVYIGNLVSNERHQTPFESEGESAGVDRSASLNFKLGNQKYSAEDFDNARQHYNAARDLDLLRFRAPSQFNRIIKELANEHGANFVDIDNQMRSDTQHGIIGQSHMLEHLHPTARGYFLIALSFLNAMQHTNFLPPSELARSNNTIEQLWNDIPLNHVDKLFSEYKVAQLTADYPFQPNPIGFKLPSPSNRFEQLAIARINGEDWLKQQQQLLTEYQQQSDFNQAAQVASVMFDALPTNHQAAAVASQLYLRINNLRMAHYHARQAVLLADGNTRYRLTLAEALFKRGLKQQSVAQLQQVLELDPSNESAQRYLSIIN